jgi:glucan phosphoethanolaminetransferase (alkaline phosphatase superfamily)
MTIGSVVIAILAVVLALFGRYFAALAICVAVTAVNAGVCYAVVLISEEAQKHPENYSTGTMHHIRELFYYSSAWLSVFGFFMIILLVWILALDIRRKRLEEVPTAQVPAEPTWVVNFK